MIQTLCVNVVSSSPTLTLCLCVSPDKSDPIEKSEVVVQLPSSERLKPSYMHRY